MGGVDLVIRSVSIGSVSDRYLLLSPVLFSLAEACYNNLVCWTQPGYVIQILSCFYICIVEKSVLLLFVVHI